MSDQQQASLHKWEIVAQGDQGGNGPIIRSAVTRVHNFVQILRLSEQRNADAIVRDRQLTGGCYRSARRPGW